MNRADLRAALAHPNVAAFLRVIRESESRQTDEGYRLENDGTKRGRVLPEYVVEHPSKGLKSPPGRAFGAYQFLASTWAGLVKRYGFEDMSPGCQNEAAVALIAGRGALDEVMAGDLEAAFLLLEKEWTSLPGGAEENAATAHARETFLKWGGKLAAAPPSIFGQEISPSIKTTIPGAPTDPDAWQRDERYGEAVHERTANPIPSADEQEANMAPLIIPLLQVAAQFIPQIAEKFGSGSEVANRNLAAGKVLAEAITSSTNSPNLQAAVEKMAAGDAQAVKAAKVAVAQAWPDLFEVGGGIKAARENAAQYATGEWWRMLAVPQTWIALLLLGLVYMALGNVTGLFGFQGWTPELRSNVVFAIVGVAIGSVSGYYFGTSQGSQRKTDILANQEK